MGQHKAEARAQAAALWATSPRAHSALCDTCGAVIDRPAGFVSKRLFAGPYDLLCESCFDTSPTADAYVGTLTVALDATDTSPGGWRDWSYIRFVLAMTWSALFWVGAIVSPLIKWRGLTSGVGLVVGIVLAVQAALLVREVRRDGAGAPPLFVGYVATLLGLFVIQLIDTRAGVVVWIGFSAAWGGITFLLRGHVFRDE